MDSVNDPVIGVGATALLCDLANGCTILRRKNDLPFSVFPAPGGPAPCTKSPAPDSFVEQLVHLGFVSEKYTLTDLGYAYYEAHFKK
jgi:hypothetical protein